MNITHLKKENKELKLKLNIISECFKDIMLLSPYDELNEIEEQERILLEKKIRIKNEQIEKLQAQKEKNKDEISKKHNPLLEIISNMRTEVELAERQFKIDVDTEIYEANKEINTKLEKLNINQETAGSPAKMKEDKPPKTERAPTYRVNNEARYLKEKHNIKEVYYTSNKSNYKLTNRGTYWVDEDGEVHNCMNSHSKKRINQRGAKVTTKENAWAVHSYFGKEKSGEKLVIYKPTAEDEGKW